LVSGSTGSASSLAAGRSSTRNEGEGRTKGGVDSRETTGQSVHRFEGRFRRTCVPHLAQSYNVAVNAEIKRGGTDRWCCMRYWLLPAVICLDQGFRQNDLNVCIGMNCSLIPNVILVCRHPSHIVFEANATNSTLSKPITTPILL